VPNSGALAMVAYATVLGFGIVAAASQIGVAATLVSILFTGVVAAAAIAFGLAFGLGGREEAARVLRDWRGQATTTMEHVDETAAQRTQDGHPDSLIATGPPCRSRAPADSARPASAAYRSACPSMPAYPCPRHRW
jgi:hypothetical protein